jgi:serine/threonine protein kinase
VAGPRARRQFLREARAAAALQHPHIVSVFESGETEETCYLASAYCPGGTLAEYLHQNSGSLPFREAASLIAILAEAVHYAHENGVLHCDLKPGNVLLDTIKRDSQDAYPIDSLSLLPFLPRLTDFGLARFFEPVSDQPSNSIVSLESRGQSLSFWHSIAGTPSYMAPEQIEGRVNEIGRATDVYGLGAMLYELLTGQTPFGAGSRQEILHRVVRDETPPVRQWKPSAPRDLEAICLKSLEKMARPPICDGGRTKRRFAAIPARRSHGRSTRFAVEASMAAYCTSSDVKLDDGVLPVVSLGRHAWWHLVQAGTTSAAARGRVARNTRRTTEKGVE